MGQLTAALRAVHDRLVGEGATEDDLVKVRARMSTHAHRALSMPRLASVEPPPFRLHVSAVVARIDELGKGRCVC